MATRKFWGWGYAGHELDPAYLQRMTGFLQAAFGIREWRVQAPPRLEDLRLRAPRFALPAALAAYCSADPFERAAHHYGQSFRDVWRALHGRFPHPPDYVAFPRSEEQIAALMAFAGAEGIALVPYGGGSSVTGGVESSAAGRGVISVDLRHFDRILAVDPVSRCAHIEAGIYGPALEEGLRPHGLTLRHFPQSFEFSTLGGWIATRSGGHYATLYTHIDAFVQSIRLVTPAGTLETRRLPASGAGPAEEGLLCGSEGALGIITAAWMRLQAAPRHRAKQTVRFPSFAAGVAAARALSQSGLHPANARLVDPLEALGNGLGDGRQAVLLLAFEAAGHDVRPSLEAALDLCRAHGGEWTERPARGEEDRDAGVWKRSFLQAPYLRDELVRRGLVVETFETAVTWDRFEAFHRAVRGAAQAAVNQHCGAGLVTCRFTHLYPDGPAPYYTVIARGEAGRQLEQWDAIKQAAADAIIAHGGTITHHHAVGRDHRNHYARQRSALFGRALQAVKREWDPEGVMNPGVLIEVNQGSKG